MDENKKKEHERSMNIAMGATAAFIDQRVAEMNEFLDSHGEKNIIKLLMHAIRHEHDAFEEMKEFRELHPADIKDLTDEEKQEGSELGANHIKCVILLKGVFELLEKRRNKDSGAEEQDTPS